MAEPKIEVVGFTGSRTVRAQDISLIRRLIDLIPHDAILVTGGCLGVDAEVARYGTRRGNHVHTILPSYHTLVDPEWETWCRTSFQMPPGTTYRDRDQRIVEYSTKLVGLPMYQENDPRSRRSGTWMTIRMARKRGMTMVVFILDEGLTGMPSRMVE